MSTKIITKALAVILAAGAITTVAATNNASAGFDGWHRRYDNDWRFHHDRDSYRWGFRHDFGYRIFRSY